jgi:hypothetical protein
MENLFKKPSQFIPLVLLLGSRYYDFDQEPYVTYVLSVFVFFQVVQFIALGLVYFKLQAMSNGPKTVKVPEKKQFGNVIAPAKELSELEYDYEMFFEKLKTCFMGTIIMLFVFYKWGKALPLLLQGSLVPCHLYEGELYSIHLRNMPAEGRLSRPFAPSNPFEQMMAQAGGDAQTRGGRKEEKLARKKEEKKKK